MSPSEVARLRQERVKEATDLFEKQPGYAKAELEFLQRGAALNERVDFQVKVVGSPERMEHALAWLDLWAETHLDLVSDMELQKAFQTLVWNNLQYNWQQFTGRMYDEFPPQVYPRPRRSLQRAGELLDNGRIQARCGSSSPSRSCSVRANFSSVRRTSAGTAQKPGICQPKESGRRPRNNDTHP